MLSTQRNERDYNSRNALYAKRRVTSLRIRSISKIFFLSKEDFWALEIEHFISQISKLARIIIKREYAKVQHPTECRYAKRVVEQNGVGKTLLHLAAEGFKQRQLDLNTVSSKRDFSDIAKCLLEFDPDLIFLTTHPKVRKLPVELALENYDDEMASLLINATTSKSRYLQRWLVILTLTLIINKCSYVLKFLKYLAHSSRLEKFSLNKQIPLITDYKKYSCAVWMKIVPYVVLYLICTYKLISHTTKQKSR